MGQLLEELQDKKEIQEDKSWTDFEEYMTSWDPAGRRVETLATPIWHMTQGNATKTMNLENDFEELATRAKEFVWSGEEDNPRARMGKTEGSWFQGDLTANDKTCHPGNE